MNPASSEPVAVDLGAVTPSMARTADIAGAGNAIYTGELYHHRLGPGPERRFSYRVAMPFVDARDIGGAVAAHPMWSGIHPAPVWLRRADYFGNPARPLDQEIRDLVEARGGARPAGPVMVLGHPRTWGWSFNPITLYFCFSPDATSVQHLVADVENTPWHEHHQYVIGAPGQHVVEKAMHVSPFLPMQLRYRVTYAAPSQSLDVRFDVEGQDGVVFVAVLSLRRRPFDRAGLTRLMTRYPLMAHKVSAGIYSQAARLALAGAPYYPHPRRSRTHAPGGNGTTAAGPGNGGQ
jgi:DUF1365 family protein